MPRAQEDSSDFTDLSEESKLVWNKMLLFKQRFKDQESRAQLLERNLTEVNLELSLVKKENSRLNEKLEDQRSSINKYQQILKDLVQVEDRYCKLLGEKKKTDEELSAEKKHRLELQGKWSKEKAELQKSLQDELQMLKEDAISKENILQNEYSKIIEEQKAEIISLKQQLSNASEAHKKEQPYEEDRIRSNNKKHQQLELPYPTRSMLPNQRNSSAHNKPQSGTTHIVLSNQHDLAPSRAEGRKCNALEVTRVPSRISKSPTKKKRKLYSRSDDTI